MHFTRRDRGWIERLRQTLGARLDIGITKAEAEVAYLLLCRPRIRNKEIARHRGCRVSGIKRLLESLYPKLGVSDRREAVRKMKALAGTLAVFEPPWPVSPPLHPGYKLLDETGAAQAPPP